MDQNERKKIYTLLSKFYPHARQLADRDTLAAWGLALEKFPYEAVKSAVLEYAAHNKYFPDLADLTAHLAEPTAPRRGGLRSGAVRDWTAHRGLYDLWRAEEERLYPLRRAAGLPGAWAEAQAAGMSYTQWRGLLDRRGLNSENFCKEACPCPSI